MPKRTRQDDDSDYELERQRTLARNRQRKHRAALTEDKLQQKRERDRLYRAQARARQARVTRSPVPTPDHVESDDDVGEDASDVEEGHGNAVATASHYSTAHQEDDAATEFYGNYDHADSGGELDPAILSDSDASIDERDVFGEWMDPLDDAYSEDVPVSEPPPPPPLASRQASLPPTSDIPHRYKDLLTDVLGVQVSDKAETVTWTNGQKTVLPFLENCDANGRSTNVLENDSKYVKHLAELPEALPSSKLVVFLSKDMPEDALVEAAREALSRNKAVVVRGFVDTKNFELTEEDLQKKYSIFVDRVVQPQDMRQRTETFSAPHVKTTLREFLSDIHNPNVSRMLLDFSFPQSTLPTPFELLDDGMGIGWAQTQGVANFETASLPADLWSTRTWGIAHHAGIVSYTHHDADGAGTYCIPLVGVKCWVVVIAETSRDKMHAAHEDLMSDDCPLSQASPEVSSETIHLYPGDLLIMPPGKLHAVYSPIASMCRGGHFFNFDTMHLTELSRFLDHTRGRAFTNQVHQGTLETLCRLVLSLPFINSSRKLYKNAVVALCGMVAYHSKYTTEGEPDQRSNTIREARKIAKEVLNHFGITGLKAYEAHLESTGNDPHERGEEVNLFDKLESFRT